MQDRYAGDIGDYVKLGLLRAILAEREASSPDRKLGVAWYRFPDETHNQDGKHTSYLDQPEKFRKFDEFVFDSLKNLRTSKRSIESLTKILQPF
jgi:hypothetical protein